MSTRSERDRQKALQEKHQMILSALLKDEDNKYCVDCDAKGPRWASWNLGIFLCIRCAGIHRNLGVHISKVKSVNLDTWTSEQVAMVQEIGNSRARAVYEANIPDHFRRPQTDSSLEAFIRAKYEQKKYIAKDWVPPQPKIPQPVVEEKKEKKKSRPRPTGSLQLSGPHSSAGAVPSKSEPKTTAPTSNSSSVASSSSGTTNTTKTQPPANKSNIDDLLGLDTPAADSHNTGNDLFSDFMSAPTSTSTSETNSDSPAQNSQPSATTDTSQTNGQISDLDPGSGSTKSTKESILALYGNSSNQAMFGVPGGMYMQGGGQGAPQGQMMQNGMMGGANMGGMMGMPQHNMQSTMQGGGQQGMMMGMQANTAMQGGTTMMGMPQQMMMGQQQQQQQQQQQYNMYNMQQQQMAQMQNQMAGMNMGGQVGGFQQTAGSMGGWAQPQAAGQTLSTNLWQ